MTLGRPTRRILKSFAVLTVLGALGIGALLGALWLEHSTAVTLPTPTGLFAVGRETYVWTDGTPDTLAPVPATRRELMVWIWYPTTAAQSAATIDDYLSGPLRAAVEGARPALISRFLTRDLSKVHAVLKSHLLRGVLRVFGKLHLDGRRQLAITAYCVRSFFDAYLKGAGISRPQISSPLYPEIQVLE
ncbi:MAG: hypothetical protein HYS05_20930 [Acidobacteria bacterium]|nr:hypothetical protein [Acidobacteriota bacterium]